MSSLYNRYERLLHFLQNFSENTTFNFNITYVSFQPLIFKGQKTIEQSLHRIKVLCLQNT